MVTEVAISNLLFQGIDVIIIEGGRTTVVVRYIFFPVLIKLILDTDSRRGFSEKSGPTKRIEAQLFSNRSSNSLISLAEARFLQSFETFCCFVISQVIS